MPTDMTKKKKRKIKTDNHESIADRMINAQLQIAMGEPVDDEDALWMLP